MDIKAIGVDIAKRHFQVHGIDPDGVAVLRRKLHVRPTMWLLLICS